MHTHGLYPRTQAHIYNTAIHPCLTYAAHTMYLKKSEIHQLEIAQGNTVKLSLSLSKSCRTTPLLLALGIPHISQTSQTVGLLRRYLLSDSISHNLYWGLLQSNINTCPAALLSRASSIMSDHRLNLHSLVFENKAPIKLQVKA